MASEITTYGTLSNIAGICSIYGVKCYPCAYLSAQFPADGANEINALIAVANQNYPTTVGLVVGSEAILQGYNAQTLISNINYVRMMTHTNFPVGTREIPSNLLNNPEVVSNSDFVMADIYAYWAQISISNAATWTIQQWQALTNAFPGKRVLIGEANWPTGGTNTMFNNPAIVPSVANQAIFLSQLVSMANSNHIEYFIFSERDELWKVQEGVGTVEQHWGLTDTNNVKKQSLVDFLSANFSMNILSTSANHLTMAVQTFEGDAYSLIGKTNFFGNWQNSLFTFTGASGTNQTIITVTNAPNQNSGFYEAMQDF